MLSMEFRVLLRSQLRIRLTLAGLLQRATSMRRMGRDEDAGNVSTAASTLFNGHSRYHEHPPTRLCRLYCLSDFKQRHRVSDAHTEEVCHQNLLRQRVACANRDDGLECFRGGKALWESFALSPLLFFLKDVEQCHHILEAAITCQHGVP